jgi:hypothetical protein
MTQHTQISDRVTAVGEHHRHIDRDTARFMHWPALPQPGQSITESAGQARCFGDICQQPDTGMTDHASR